MGIIAKREMPDPQTGFDFESDPSSFVDPTQGDPPSSLNATAMAKLPTFTDVKSTLPGDPGDEPKDEVATCKSNQNLGEALVNSNNTHAFSPGGAARPREA
jgi:hypothetical protein